MPAGTKRKRSNNIRHISKKPRLNISIGDRYKSIINAADRIESPLEHLTKILAPGQNNLIDLLMIADTCHDFRGRNLVEFNSFINPIIDTHDIDQYIKQFPGVTLNAIEETTEAYFEKKIPHLIGVNPLQPHLVSLYDIQSFRSADNISHLNNFELLYTVDAQDINDKLMQFFYKDYVTSTTLVYFTFDAASYGIIYDIYKNTQNVRHLLTPQNILDSARTNPEDKFKDKTEWLNIEGIKCTANYYTRDYIDFYTGSDSYNNILHFCKIGDNTIPIYVADHGPGVPDLMRIMSCRGDYKDCSKKIFTESKSTDYSSIYSIVNSNEFLYRLTFDIKRMGDHEQANAVYYNNIYNKKKTIFGTIDRLAALYSRLIGNPSVLFKAAKNSIVCYNGRVSYSEKDRIIDEITYKVNAINYISSTYPKIIDLIENATNYIAGIKTYINYTIHLTDAEAIFNLLVSIKLLDIIQLITNISTAVGDIGRFKQDYIELESIFILMKGAIICEDFTKYDIDRLGALNIDLDTFIEHNNIITNIATITKYISTLNTIVDPIENAPIFNKPIFYSADLGVFINNETFRFNISNINNIMEGIRRLLAIPLVGRSSRATMLKTAKKLRATSLGVKIGSKINMLRERATELQSKKRTKKIQRELNKIVAKQHAIITQNMKYKYLFDNPNINYNATAVNDIKMLIDSMLSEYFSNLHNTIIIDSKEYTNNQIGELIGQYIDNILNSKLGIQRGAGSSQETQSIESAEEIVTSKENTISLGNYTDFHTSIISTMTSVSKLIYNIINKKYRGLSIKDMENKKPYVFTYPTFDSIYNNMLSTKKSSARSITRKIRTKS